MSRQSLAALSLRARHMLKSRIEGKHIMKKLLLIIPLVLSLMSCAAREIDIEQIEERDGIAYAVDEDKPYSGKVTGFVPIWYTDRKKWNELNVVNGKQEGLQRSWYENGQLESEGNYVKGQREGLQRGWHENGQLRREETYVNDELEGLCRYWYKNGQLRFEYIRQRQLY
jgi:antitoxin component YwqK of YwqJK toxin-antitoxin module